jgi:hypothetical protein
MTTSGKFATTPKFRSSKRTAVNDDAAANEEEIEQQIEEADVEKTARENRIGGPVPRMSNEEMAADDDAVASREEVEEQGERKRVEENAFENRISAASAEKWIQNGRARE